MSSASIPYDDEARLRSLVNLEVLDTAPEAEFDALVKVAAMVCGVPISLLSLVDESRQWFKANVGLPGVNETPRDVAFCAHAIHGDALFEVPDATKDARFADNPLVTGDPTIRFYAGAPLSTALPVGSRWAPCASSTAGRASGARSSRAGSVSLLTSCSTSFARQR